MAKLMFKTENSVGHIEGSQEVIDQIIQDNEDEEMEEGLYPAGLIMEGDENDNGRDIRADDDNDSPLDRDSIFIGKDEGEGMYPAGVK